MKKLFFSLGIGFLPFAIHANDTFDYFSGFYVGSGLGFNNLEGEHRLVFDPSKVANILLYNFNDSENNSHFLGTVYLGFGHRFNAPIYMAAEGITEFAKPSTSLIIPNVHFTAKQKIAYGGRLKVGYTKTNWLFYGLLGLEKAKINHNVSFLQGGIYNSGMMLLQNISVSNSKTIKQLGAGIDVAINEHWAVQLEYAHNFYSDNNYAINHTLITFNNPKGNYYSSLNGNEGTVGLRYSFG